MKPLVGTSFAAEITTTVKKRASLRAIQTSSSMLVRPLLRTLMTPLHSCTSALLLVSSRSFSATKLSQCNESSCLVHGEPVLTIDRGVMFVHGK